MGTVLQQATVTFARHDPTFFEFVFPFLFSPSFRLVNLVCVVGLDVFAVLLISIIPLPGSAGAHWCRGRVPL